MKNYLYAIVFLIIFTSGLHAQCKRGEQLRITNDVEIKKIKDKKYRIYSLWILIAST